jgi:cell division protein FtsI (penicillin-binding protein 3)
MSVVVFFAALAMVLVARVWTLQVSQSGWFQELAQEQYLKEISLESMRGDIVARQGEPIAVSVMTDSIFAMPKELDDPAGTSKILAKVLDMDYASLYKKLSSRKHFTWIKRRVAPRKVEKILAKKIAGIYSRKESRRFYPKKELAGALVGFVGDGRGLEGIELMYDGQLRGSTVLAQGLRDVHGNMLFADGVASHEPVRGSKLVLTIDLTIQEIVERELERSMQESKAKAITAIVMEPVSGQILAIAGRPTYNPNTFWKYTPDHWRNRAVTDCYEPGSTMKVFTLAAAMQTGLAKPDETIDCENGNLQIGPYVIHDSHHKYGLLSLTQVLALSSNIGTAKVGMRLGRQGLWQALDRFGFGRLTGVNMPGESRCRLHKPQTWSEVGLANISFGQGLSVTPLQIVTALCSIANGGVWMRPAVIKEIRDHRDQVVQEFYPDPAGRVLEKKWADAITRMMVNVTQPGGTGARAAIDGYQVAGKTGTAQKADPIAGGYSKDKRVASFMGFVPAEQPRLAILVVVDEPTSSPYGGVVAAPVFARIAKAALRYLGVFPKAADNQSQIAAVDNSNLQSQEESLEKGHLKVGLEGISVPNVRGLSVREAIRRLSIRGLAVSIRGSGRVVRQNLITSSSVDLGPTVSLELERCLGSSCRLESLSTQSDGSKFADKGIQ